MAPNVGLMPESYKECANDYNIVDLHYSGVHKHCIQMAPNVGLFLKSHKIYILVPPENIYRQIRVIYLKLR